MVQILLILSVLFSGQYSAASCGGNFISPEPVLNLKTTNTRPVSNGGGNVGPELRAVLVRWLPEFAIDELKSILPTLEQDLRLEDKVASPRGFGVTVLKLREQPIALIKWQRNPVYGGPEYMVTSAVSPPAQGPLALREYLLKKLKRVDPWAPSLILPAGFALFEGGRYSLDPSAEENLSEIEQHEVVRIVYGRTMLESNRMELLRDLDGRLMLSVRHGASTGEPQLWQFEKDEGERVVEKIARELGTSPRPFMLEASDYLTLNVPYIKGPVLKVVPYLRKGAEPIKILVVADDKSHDPEFPGWPLFNTEQAIRAVSGRVAKELGLTQPNLLAAPTKASRD